MRQVTVLILLLGSLAVGRSNAAELGATPAIAVQIAHEDALRIRGEAIHTMYFFNRYGLQDLEEDGAFSYSLNLVPATNTSAELLCRRVDRSGIVLAVNLKQVWPKEEDYRRGRLILTYLATKNFYFHSIHPKFFTNKDGFSIPSEVQPFADKYEVPPFTFQGKKFTSRFFAKFTPALHLAGMYDESLWRYEELVELTGTINPIMLMDQFVSFSHRSFPAGDGEYYNLVNMPETEDEADKQAGANFKISEELRSDQRAVMWRRKLNNQPSMIEWAMTLGNHPANGMLPVWKTRDYSRRGSQARVHPLQNVLDRTQEASETFHPKANGAYKMGLWDKVGARQNVAPGSIAIDDSTSPCTEVEAGLCFRCHGPVGWIQPLQNHLIEMTNVPVKIKSRIEGFDKLPLKAKFKRLGIIDDLGQKGSLSDIYDRATGLYSGDPKDVEWQVRLAQTMFATKATGEVFGVDPTQKACAKLAFIFDRQELMPIFPLTAAKELGITCESNEEAQEILADVWIQLYPGASFSPETPTLWTIITWKGEESLALPKRQDWENDYPLLMTRVNNALRAGKLKHIKRPEGEHHLASYFIAP